MWALAVTLHAAAALGAFVVGVAALDPRRASRLRWSLPGLVGLLVAMTVFLAAAMAAHWSDLPGVTQFVFGALGGLAVYMVYRAVRASRRVRGRGRSDDVAHIDDLGFVLIALFDGFVIVAALDLGAPVWIVVPLALGAVLVGRRAVHRVRQRVEPARS